MLAGCTSLAPSLPPPSPHTNGQALWRIISEQCLPNERDRGDPAPCVVVSLRDGDAHGYVLLKDRVGVAQHLLMPTAKITGIEDPKVLEPGAENYFARAWDERRYVQERLGRRVERTELSIAVNSAYGRSQDQLHLHIDCVDATVAAALRDAAIPNAWARRPVTLKGRSYRVRWLAEDQLNATNPFNLLAQTVPGARRSMGAWTLALIGGVGPGGQPGFYLVADQANPATGDPGSAEVLQDHTCASVPPS
jgi:CDP-diacylglycerol pyrophosphatase